MTFDGTFSEQQTKQLLQPINPRRVLRDGRGNSHVSQQDVTAHLIRVFGFGNFKTELLDVTLIAEECRNPEDPYARRKWDVTYRATMRLTIFDRNHDLVTSFEDSSCGDAQNQVRHDAHDLALKSAISLAKKRCTINLGDQFGLSLYNKGQMEALVIASLVTPSGMFQENDDVQSEVPQQESMGHDEIEKESPEATDEQEAMLERSLGATRVGTEPPEEPQEPAQEPQEPPTAPEPTEAPTEAQEPTPEDGEAEEPGITQAQHAKIGALLREKGITTRQDSIDNVVQIIGRPIQSRNDLTRHEAGRVIDTLEG